MPALRRRQDYGLWLPLLRPVPYAHGLPEVLADYRVRAGLALGRQARRGAGDLAALPRGRGPRPRRAPPGTSPTTSPAALAKRAGARARLSRAGRPRGRRGCAKRRRFFSAKPARTGGRGAAEDPGEDQGAGARLGRALPDEARALVRVHADRQRVVHAAQARRRGSRRGRRTPRRGVAAVPAPTPKPSSKRTPAARTGARRSAISWLEARAAFSRVSRRGGAGGACAAGRRGRASGRRRGRARGSRRRSGGCRRRRPAGG